MLKKNEVEEMAEPEEMTEPLTSTHALRLLLIPHSRCKSNVKNGLKFFTSCGGSHLEFQHSGV